MEGKATAKAVPSGELEFCLVKIRTYAYDGVEKRIGILFADRPIPLYLESISETVRKEIFPEKMPIASYLDCAAETTKKIEWPEKSALVEYLDWIADLWKKNVLPEKTVLTNGT